MDIKCWGSRGSIPVSGKPYLKYGGDTTCIEVTAKSGETVIIDAGTGIRRLGKSLHERQITRYYLLFTHAHWDHILGFPFFSPLYHKENRIIIQDRNFGTKKTEQILESVMKEPFFPITINDFKADICFDAKLVKTFSIGSLDIETISTSHPGGGLGYKFTEEDRKFVFLTDNELGIVHPGGNALDRFLDFIKDADILFHDGEYTTEEYNRKKGWGHSSISQVIDLAGRTGVKQLGLFHLNQDRTDVQVDDMIGNVRARLKQEHTDLDFFAVYSDMTLHL